MNTATKTNNIQYIPTKLNWINYTNNRLKSHRQDINISRGLIIGLIAWNLATTIFLIFDNIELPPPPLQAIPVELLED